MATGAVTRLAGKALGDFLKVATTVGSAAVENKVLNALSGASEFVDAPGVAGVVARHPQSLAKVAGVAAPALAAGGVAAVAGLINAMSQQPSNIYAQSQYSLPLRGGGTPVSFANQQYLSGVSPLTNQTAAEAMLEQQKFQHQLQLIQARQNTQTGVGAMQSYGPGSMDIMGLSQQIFKPVSY